MITRQTGLFKKQAGFILQRQISVTSEIDLSGSKVYNISLNLYFIKPERIYPDFYGWPTLNVS
jgi:hypothetical protein